jgi:hypothetical protein
MLRTLARMRLISSWRDQLTASGEGPDNGSVETGSFQPDRLR